MTRKKMREHLFIMLFRVDFYNEADLEEQVQEYLEEMTGASDEEKVAIEEKFHRIVACKDELDQKIAANSKGWDLKRLAKADVTVLRLAMYEILYDESVPAGVAINEAVELSKQYGTDKSSSFVNGLLATIAREQEAETEEQ